MRKFSVFLTLVLVLVFGFRGCDANGSGISKPPSSFFEKREMSCRSVTVEIANDTDWEIFCIVIRGNETVSKSSIRSGEFLHCQIKNLYNYNLPIYCRMEIVILAIDCRGKLMAIARKELRINFCSLFPREKTLIISSLSEGSENLLKIEEMY